MSADTDPVSLLCRGAERAVNASVTVTTPPLTKASGTVVRLRTGDIELVAKVHRRRDLHEREVHAYRTWTPYLDGAAPRLIAVEPDAPGIVLTAVAGTPLDTLDLGTAERRWAHRGAGKILRRLHERPAALDATQATDYLAARSEYWLHELAGHTTSRDRNLVRGHVRDLTTITGARVAPCHLDFQPRNLLTDTGQCVHVVDFENSRPDLAARDLARLATRVWPHHPDLRAAFLDGYGPLDGNDRAVLGHVTALEAVTSLGYGIRTNDNDLVDIGRTLLAQLRISALPWE